MPNWCNNMLIVEGSSESLCAFAEKAQGPDQHYGPQLFELMDAARALMADNDEVIDIKDEFQQARLKKLLTEGDPRLAEVIKKHSTEPEPDPILSFHQLFPVPDEILEGRYDPDGYQWEVQNWGVKWGCSNAQLSSDGGLKYRFNTPWGPPLKFLEKVSADFPELEFTCRWAEPGMMAAGKSVFKSGEETREEWPMGEDDEEYFDWDLEL